MGRMKIRKQRNEKGITLVALVVTIIVLIILAGITISLVLGQNGIIGKTREAKEASTNADKETIERLNSLEDQANDAIKGIVSPVGKYKDTQTVVSSNTEIKDDEGNMITIPAGFKIASDSATKQEDGIVIEDKDGNQYVWIPVANIANYERTDFGSNFDRGGSYSAYSETMPSDEQTSVSTYHGYYIGRYEAGDVTATVNKILKDSEVTGITSAVSIKKGQSPYNFVSRDQAITLATGMKTQEGYIATTKLCSSYAWDTAINFIQNKVANYGTSSPQGDYADTTVTYTDLTGATHTDTTEESRSDVLIPTGQTTSVCNIYDMGGNAWEWTTETTNSLDDPYVYRGGYYCCEYAVGPAGYRNCCAAVHYDYPLTFRVTLYI